MPYSTIVSLSPVFHQICSSDLVSDAWIQLTGIFRMTSTVTEAWVNEASRYFQYLATLCELASKQVNESVQSFLTRTMATVDVLNKVEFEAQMNSTVAQLITSILIRFRLFMETSQGLDARRSTIESTRSESTDIQRQLHPVWDDQPTKHLRYVFIGYLGRSNQCMVYFSTYSCRIDLWQWVNSRILPLCFERFLSVVDFFLWLSNPDKYDMDWWAARHRARGLYRTWPSARMLHDWHAPSIDSSVFLWYCKLLCKPAQGDQSIGHISSRKHGWS